MSNFLAIATVTEALRQVLEDHVKKDVPGAQATAVRPSAATGSGGVPATGVNVFLYQISPNPAGRNLDLPTRRADGSLAQRPRAAIDLHYILSVYGAESSYEPQRVMGSVVRTMHAKPLITRKAIADAMATHAFLATSDLVSELELVKFTPSVLTLDELSRIWSIFFQTSYALSVCYQASVVFLEETTAVSAALPVRTRNIVTVPMDLPVIESITPQPILAGGMVTIAGQNVGRHVPFVQIGEAGPVAALVVSANEITIPLPATVPAGVSSVRVIQKIDLGTGNASEPHRGFESNVAAMAVAPTIKPTLAPTVARGAVLTVDFDRDVGRTQKVALLLGDRAIPLPSRPSVKVGTTPPAPPTATSFDVTIPLDFPTGAMLVRLRVDGVESALDVDTNPASPTFDQYVGPKVSVT
jgi:hypothetical protein